MRIIVGIDPGLTGGVAVLNELGDLDTWPLPTLGKKNRILDIARLTRWLSDRDVNEAIIEQAQPWPKQGVSGIFNYGVAYGQLIAMLQVALAVPYVAVHPLVWKKTYGLVNSKKLGRTVNKVDSLRRAVELFPRHADQFSQKGSIHRAEAALIARWRLG